MVVQKLLLRQYCIKITVLLGSGYIVEHNHKFIKEIPLSSNHSITPSPLHNHPETQNGPDIQSEYISKEIPNETQKEPNVVHHDTPLINLPRALQRLANYNKPGLK